MLVSSLFLIVEIKAGDWFTTRKPITAGVKNQDDTKLFELKV
jgi:hypothetical protein